MSNKAMLALALCAGFALPATAQQTPAPQPPASPAQQPAASPPASTPALGQQSSASKGDNGMAIQAKLTQDLGKAGFTSIEVMPESFLVRAKDKEGRPVMMVINPDSITTLTSMNQAAGGAPADATPAKK